MFFTAMYVVMGLALILLVRRRLLLGRGGDISRFEYALAIVLYGVILVLFVLGMVFEVD